MRSYSFLPVFGALAAAQSSMMSEMSSASMAMSAAATSTMAAAMGAGVTHTVTVGGVKLQATGSPTPMLMYNPESVMAAVGDTVEFMFMQMNHSVTQSTFAAPCNKMASGMDSGFMPNPSGEVGKVTWQMKVTTTDPVWMYCRQTGHCGKGMVFAVNPAASGDKTFQLYKQLAITNNSTGLQQAPIVQGTASAVASTVTLAATSLAATAASAAAASSGTASVVSGQGQAANGGTCSCSCLCGQNSWPANAAQNNFGGFAGMMPAMGS